MRFQIVHTIIFSLKKKNPVCSHGFGHAQIIEIKIVGACNVPYLAGSLTAWRKRECVSVNTGARADGGKQGAPVYV